MTINNAPSIVTSNGNVVDQSGASRRSRAGSMGINNVNSSAEQPQLLTVSPRGFRARVRNFFAQMRSCFSCYRCRSSASERTGDVNAAFDINAGYGPGIEMVDPQPSTSGAQAAHRDSVATSQGSEDLDDLPIAGRGHVFLGAAATAATISGHPPLPKNAPLKFKPNPKYEEIRKRREADKKALQDSKYASAHLANLLPSSGRDLIKVNLKSNGLVKLEPSRKGKVLYEDGRLVLAPTPGNNGCWQLMVTAGPNMPTSKVKNEITLEKAAGLHHLTVNGTRFIFKIWSDGICTVSYADPARRGSGGLRSTRL